MEDPNLLICCGVSHKTLPLAPRERIQPARELWGEMLHNLLRHEELYTGVLVATCNRVEFYLKTQSERGVLERVLDVLGVGDEERDAVRAASYLLQGDDAVRHLFRVAAGLDSMAIGESEVLGQIKDAYSLACRHGTVQHLMHRLFHSAFRVGKHVRNETELGRGVRSLCGAALDLMSEGADGLDGRLVVLVGVNAMTETVAARTRGRARCIFLNRTHCKASALAVRHGGESRRFRHLKEAMIEADAVFTSTGATEPILTPADLDEVLRARAGRRPLVVCDLAVPRDVQPPEQPDPRLVLIDQEAIQERVQDEDHYRSEQVQGAEEIVEEHVSAFWFRMSQGELSESAQQLLSGAQRALERELGYCRRVRTPEEVALLADFGRRLVDKVCSLGLMHMRAERAQEGCASGGCASHGHGPLVESQPGELA
jgi:glutamyl-tRNA reductase